MGIMCISCFKETWENEQNSRQENEFFSVDEAQKFFENSFITTRSNNKKYKHLDPGDFTPKWREAKISKDNRIASVDIPIQSKYRFRSMRSESNNGKVDTYSVEITQKLIVIKNKLTKEKVQYIMTLIPDKSYYAKNKGNISQSFWHLGNKNNFTGVVIYTDPILNLPVRIDKYKNGNKEDGVSFQTTRDKLPERFAKMRKLIGIIKIQRGVSLATTRSNGEDDSSWWGDTWEDVNDWTEEAYNDFMDTWDHVTDWSGEAYDSTVGTINDFTDWTIEQYNNAPITAGFLYARYSYGETSDFYVDEGLWGEISGATDGLDKDNATKVYIDGTLYYKQSQSFYLEHNSNSNQDLRNSFGTATVYYNSEGIAVGFFDKYDFDKKDPGERPGNAEESTEVGGSLDRDGYKIIYGITE